MWEKIKNFFKWIADHTGISWFARKISSDWKWLFGGKANTTQQNTSQHEERSDNEKQEPAQANDQSKDHTTPKTLDNEVNPDQPTPPGKPKELVVDKHEKAGELKLEKDGLILWLEQPVKIKNYEDSQSVTENRFSSKLLLYLRCDKGEYRITGSGNSYCSSEYVIVKSILKKNEDGNYIDSNTMFVKDGIENVKKMLGLSDGVTKIKVDSISNRVFEAPTLEQPKLNTTTTQQVVNNYTTIDQTTPSAVPNEPQETLVNAHEEKVEPNNAASNEEVQPGVSNEEVTIEVDSISNRVFEAPTLEQPKLNTTTTQQVVNNYTTIDQTTPSAVPNEPQETLVNAHEEKVEPNNAASNEEVQPGVSNEEVTIEVDSISNRVFEAPTLEQPKLNTTTTQQVVNNYTTIDQTTPSAVPNEPQETLVNAHEEKVEPNNAASNEEVQPGVSNEEVTIEVDSISNRVFEAPTLEQPKLNTTTTQQVVNNYTTIDQTTPSAVPNEPQETLVNAHEEKVEPNNAASNEEVQPGVSNEEVTIEVDSISNRVFEAPTLEQPKLNTTTTQQVVNNYTTIDQTTPSAVPNEPQETLVNAHEEKVEPNNAASNEEVQPGVSNEEVTIEVDSISNRVFEAPTLEQPKLNTTTTQQVVNNYTTIDQTTPSAVPNEPQETLVNAHEEKVEPNNAASNEEVQPGVSNEEVTIEVDSISNRVFEAPTLEQPKLNTTTTQQVVNNYTTIDQTTPSAVPNEPQETLVNAHEEKVEPNNAASNEEVQPGVSNEEVTIEVDSISNRVFEAPTLEQPKLNTTTTQQVVNNYTTIDQTTPSAVPNEPQETLVNAHEEKVEPNNAASNEEVQPGVSNEEVTIEVDSISNRVFEAPTLEQPKLNTTTTQQVVNNYTTIDQTTPSAVPNEPQETLVNAHEEKVEPNNAASNEEVQPGVSNEEVTIEVDSISNRVFEAPTLEQPKLNTTTTQQVVNNYTTIDQTTPSAVPNEPQETLVNAHEEKVEPNNAASNEEVQPGVSNEEVTIEVDSISNRVFEAPTLEQPKLNTTTTQQVVNNYTTIDQTTPSAVPNEPQETLVNAHEEKVEPNNAASNEEVQPGVSNEEVTIEVDSISNRVFEAPTLEQPKLNTTTTQQVVNNYTTIDQTTPSAVPNEPQETLVNAHEEKVEPNNAASNEEVQPGVSNEEVTIEVDSISNRVFEAPTLEQPKLNTTTTQQVVNNYTTIDQTTPSAVPNEPQETLVNAHEEKVEPNNAASNEEVQPGVSNEEVTIEVDSISNRVFEAPTLEQPKLNTTTTQQVVNNYTTIDQTTPSAVPNEPQETLVNAHEEKVEPNNAASNEEVQPGVSNEEVTIEVDSISNRVFEAPTLEQPKLNTTTTQQVVNNYTTIDQTTPSAVPNEPQETLVNAHEEKVEPNNAASNEEVQPGVSNEEVTIEVDSISNRVFEAPTLEQPKLNTTTTQQVVNNYTTIDQTTPSAVPNEPQETLVNAHEEKVEPNNAASNEEVQPGVSNEEVTIEVDSISNRVFEAPTLEQPKLNTTTTQQVVNNYTTIDQTTPSAVPNEPQETLVNAHEEKVEPNNAASNEEVQPGVSNEEVTIEVDSISNRVFEAPTLEQPKLNTTTTQQVVNNYTTIDQTTPSAVPNEPQETLVNAHEEKVEPNNAASNEEVQPGVSNEEVTIEVDSISNRVFEAPTLEQPKLNTTTTQQVVNNYTTIDQTTPSAVPNEPQETLVNAHEEKVEPNNAASNEEVQPGVSNEEVTIEVDSISNRVFEAPTLEQPKLNTTTTQQVVNNYTTIDQTTPSAVPNEPQETLVNAHEEKVEPNNAASNEEVQPGVSNEEVTIEVDSISNRVFEAPTLEQPKLNTTTTQQVVNNYTTIDQTTPSAVPNEPQETLVNAHEEKVEPNNAASNEEVQPGVSNEEVTIEVDSISNRVFEAPTLEQPKLNTTTTQQVVNNYTTIDQTTPSAVPNEPQETLVNAHEEKVEPNNAASNEEVQPGVSNEEVTIEVDSISNRVFEAPTLEQPKLNTTTTQQVVNNYTTIDQTTPSAVPNEPQETLVNAHEEKVEPNNAASNEEVQPGVSNEEVTIEVDSISNRVFEAPTLEQPKLNTTTTQQVVNNYTTIDQTTPSAVPNEPQETLVNAHEEKVEPNNAASNEEVQPGVSNEEVTIEVDSISNRVFEAPTLEQPKLNTTTTQQVVNNYTTIDQTTPSAVPNEPQETLVNAHEEKVEPNNAASNEEVQPGVSNEEVTIEVDSISNRVFEAPTLEQPKLNTTTTQQVVNNYTTIDQTTPSAVPNEPQETLVNAHEEKVEPNNAASNEEVQPGVSNEEVTIEVDSISNRVFEAPTLEQPKLNTTTTQQVVNNYTTIDQTTPSAVPNEPQETLVNAHEEKVEPNNAASNEEVQPGVSNEEVTIEVDSISNRVFEAPTLEQPKLNTTTTQQVVNNYTTIDQTTPSAVPNEPQETLVNAHEEKVEPNNAASNEEVQPGVSNEEVTIEVDSISNRVFEAPTLEQPKLNTTTTQQVVNNYTTIDQTTPSAVPNEPQETLVNAHEEKVEPNNAASNEEVQPGVSNEEVTIEVDSISNRVFEAPTLEQPKLNTTTTQQVVNNYTTIDQTTPSAVPNEPQETLVNAHEEKVEPNNAASNEEVQPGVSNEEVTIEVDSISNRVFEAPTLEQPKLNTTTTQQVVNNYTTIDQTTPSAVPNEPQETLVNAHEEKVEPNNAASNEEVQPGVSNEEVTIEVDSISNRVFEAPTLEQPKLNTTTTQQVVNNYTTIDQTTPSAVPNEPQETLVNAHEEKVEPNNAASNEEVQPGVSNEEVTIEVDSISNRVFEAPTLEQPKLNTTTTQQVVNNYTTIDQTTPSAVPNEPQETLVNAHEEKVEPNNAASNEEVQPGVSNEEVTIESEELFDAEVASPSETKNGSNNGAVVLYQMLHDKRRLHFSPELYDYLLGASLKREILFCKVVPSSLFTQSTAEQAADNIILVNQ